MVYMSEKEAIALGLIEPEKKKHKYNAQRTTIDGHTFPSLKEANRYCELKILLRAGEIRDLVLQPAFVLQEKQPGIRAIKYKADFQYIRISDGQLVVEETKGFKTKDYAIRRKLFLARYPEIEFIEL